MDFNLICKEKPGLSTGFPISNMWLADQNLTLPEIDSADTKSSPKS
jgi:hypothetical protein